MALYKVTRNNAHNVKLDEFVEGEVIAYSAKAAREAVAHLPGVTEDNVEAVPTPTTGIVRIVSVYYSEV